MPRQQSGYIWKVGGSWYGRWREDVLEEGRVIRKQRSVKLADVSDRYRTKADVRPLLAEKLRPINEGRHRPESTLPVADFVEDFYLPFVKENYKPSTSVGYQKIWKKHLAPRLSQITLRDFRTVDAANLLAEIHRQNKLGRTMLKHIKAFLSGVFTYAKNQGALDGINPVQDAMIPKKAAAPEETHAATLEEVLAMMDTLDKAGEKKARAAVAVMFFAGLRPGEARGVCWEDFDGKRLFVRRSIWRVWTTSPKTESSVKPVPVIEPLLGILAEGARGRRQAKLWANTTWTIWLPTGPRQSGRESCETRSATLCRVQEARVQARRGRPRVSAGRNTSEVARLVFSSARRGYRHRRPIRLSRSQRPAPTFQRQHN
jgi:integrase